MIQITIPLSCITMMSEEYQSEKKNSVKKKRKMVSGDLLLLMR